MKLTKTIVTISVISIMVSTTAFAGTWKTGVGVNQDRWWYDNEDGTYANGGWHWIDGNNDKTEECYYFDENGWLLTDIVTPDGYLVNNNGQWIMNGGVKVRGNTNSSLVSDSKRENAKIKSLEAQEVGRPTWALGMPDACTRKGKLKTIEKLDYETNLIPTFIYNEKGYLIDMYDYSSGESYDISNRKTVPWERKYNRWMYSYDDNGRIIRKWQLTPDFEGVPTNNDSHWSYEYDSKGKLINEIQNVYQNKTGYIHRQTSYYYDNYGRLIKKVVKNARSAPGTGITFLYATHGEIEVIKYVYDDSSRTIKMYATYDGKGSTPAGTVSGGIYKANEEGNIIEIQSGSTSSFKEYDSDGRIIRTYSKSNTGEIHSDSKYIYE